MMMCNIVLLTGGTVILIIVLILLIVEGIDRLFKWWIPLEPSHAYWLITYQFRHRVYGSPWQYTNDVYDGDLGNWIVFQDSKYERVLMSAIPIDHQQYHLLQQHYREEQID